MTNPLRVIDWRSVESMSTDDELEKLEEWAGLNQDSSAWALELGSFKGKTTAIIAQFFEKVVAGDLWGNVDHGVGSYDQIGTHHFDAFIRNMTRLKLINIVIPVVGTLDHIAQLFTPERFVFIFVDGDHSYEWCKKDLEAADPLLSPGGLLVCHDYKRPGFGYPPFTPGHPHHGPIDPWGGVARAVDEFLASRPNYAIHEHFAGIVAMRKESHV
jgi:hypothetical protein